MKKEKKNICCICGLPYLGSGNNALPLKNGRCCDDCDMFVIEDRIKRLKTAKND